MFLVEKLVCFSCFEERCAADDHTLHLDELVPASPGAVQVVQDGDDACRESTLGAMAVRSSRISASGSDAAEAGVGDLQAEEVEEQAGPLAAQQELLEVGCRVRARVPILYQTESVQVGGLGTVLEISPSVAVRWDGLSMPRAVVRRSQVELLPEGQVEPLPEKGVHFSEELAAHEDQEEVNRIKLGAKVSDANNEKGSFDVHITVSRESVDDPLGLCFDVCDGRALCIHAIRPGSSAASSHNASVPEWQQLRPGDYVLEVNGERSSAKAMIREAEQGAETRFVLRRPTTFVAELNKKGGCLGLGLNHAARATSLVVEAIQDGGPVVRWNDEHPEQEIRRGDRILAVNGFKGSSRELLQGLSESGPLALLMARPSGPEVDRAAAASTSSSTTASGESVCSGSSGSHNGLKTAR